MSQLERAAIATVVSVAVDPYGSLSPEILALRDALRASAPEELDSALSVAYEAFLRS